MMRKRGSADIDAKKKKKKKLSKESRGSNPRPFAPKARIMPLDH